MTPDKAQQLGNDLACLAASIAEIAEEIKSLYDFDRDGDEERTEQDLQQKAPAPEPKTLTLAEVRGFLADKARTGHSEAIRALIVKRGVTKLSEVPPDEYAALIEEARKLK